MTRRLALGLALSFVLAGCPQPERTIEDTLCYIREVNESSRNIYIQYYYKTPLKPGVFLERLRLGPRSEYHNGDSNYDHGDPGINYGDANYRSAPDYACPLESIEKIVVLDADSRKVLKRILEPALVVELEYGKDNYDMRCRFEHYIVRISDALFHEQSSQ
ncbi:MAG: hypothetical protein LBU25_01225 [Treponema sp.]|jgi:hypothetical protein|nr:hypothetical protein [Treponema sp.]